MHLNCYFSVAINVYLSRDVGMRAHMIYATNKNRIFNKIPLLPATSYLSLNTISLTKLMTISNEVSAKNYEWQPWIPYQMTFGWRCFLFFLRKIFSELLLFVGPGKDCHVTALSGHALISNRTPDRSERILY